MVIKQKIFGLDISDHSIEAIQLARAFGNQRIVAYARLLLRGELIEDGVIKKPEKLAEAIKKLLASAQPQPITTPNCILSIPDSQVFTTVFKLPAGLKHEEIKNTIPFKAEEVIPFKSSEIYFDFKTIAVNGGSQEVFYAASPMKVVDAYLAVLEMANLTPVAFDLESISLARALLIPRLDTKPVSKKESGQAVLIMDLGARTANLNIFDHNGVRQSLTLKGAGNRFSKSLAKTLNLPEKEAEALKVKVGFDRKQQRGQVAAILENELKRIVAETKKFVNYYQDESGNQIGSVLLAGGSSLLPQLPEYLKENLGLAVQIGNPLRRLADPAELIKFKKKAILFANVIGLGLRAVNRNPVAGDINLLPERKRKFALAPQRHDRQAWRLVYIRLSVFAVLVLLLAGIIILKQRGYDPYQKIAPVATYQTEFNADVNLQALDQLREQFALPAAGATSTTPAVEPDLIL